MSRRSARNGISANVQQRVMLDVGCGHNKRKGWIGLDRRALPGIDIVHDVEEFPWPLEDDSCSVIMMSHLWEHISPSQTIGVMDECWRLLEPDGQLVITTPYAYSVGYIQDPTHCNPSNELTWEYFDPAKRLYKIYEPKPWRIIKIDVQMFGNMLVALNARKDRGVKPFIAPQLQQVQSDNGDLSIVDAFHVAQYKARTLENQPLWCGRRIDKNVYDLWRYHELIWGLRPTVIVEMGTANGASALFFADLMSRSGVVGKVITVDIDDGTAPFEVNPSRTNPGKRPVDARIDYVIGSSTDLEVASRVGKLVEVALKRPGPVMLVLDSNHFNWHVLRELEIYHPLVTPGSYLVVEDSNINGHPVYPDFTPGPFEALLEWLPKHPEFERDMELEARFPITHNPSGWLRRKA